MGILTAFRNGVREATRSWRYIFLVYGFNFLLAIGLASAVGIAISASVGHSAAGEKLVADFDGLWYRNFGAQAQGLAATFTPSVVGIGAVFNGLDAMLRGGLLQNHPLIGVAGLLYLLTWVFCSAGFIALYANPDDRPPFFARAAKFFPRFLVLGLMAGVLYFLVFRFVFSGLSNLVDELTRETIDERVHFVYTVIKYAIVWLLVVSVNILFDYSKIFTVLRDHGNALNAPLRSLGVVFGNFRRTYGLYVGIGIVWLLLLAVYWLIAPGAGQSSWLAIAAAFVIGQVYLLSRIWTRCLFLAGQTAMCGALLDTASTTSTGTDDT